MLLNLHKGLIESLILTIYHLYWWLKQQVSNCLLELYLLSKRSKNKLHDPEIICNCGNNLLHWMIKTSYCRERRQLSEKLTLKGGLEMGQIMQGLKEGTNRRYTCPAVHVTFAVLWVA